MSAQGCLIANSIGCTCALVSQCRVPLRRCQARATALSSSMCSQQVLPAIALADFFGVQCYVQATWWPTGDTLKLLLSV